MIHIAIMKKSWGLTQKILSGSKTIETRFYKHRARPWNSIQEGETVYFKNSGEPVTVKAEVSKVEQYENLDNGKILELLKKYSQKDLGSEEIPDEISKYVKNKKYAIIIHLKNPQTQAPFDIDKTGFGAMSAWLSVKEDLFKKIIHNRK